MTVTKSEATFQEPPVQLVASLTLTMQMMLLFPVNVNTDPYNRVAGAW